MDIRSDTLYWRKMSVKNGGMKNMDNYFVTLNSINVNDKTEKKNGLT